MKYTAIYVRVSSKSQDLASQFPELKAWELAHAGTPTRWYDDHFTGKTLKRPGMERLVQDIQRGKVDRLVVWRIDRLGRTARGLIDLFELCRESKVRVESIRDGIADLDSPSGRLMLTIISSFAQYETEVRSERQRAGLVSTLERQKEVQALAAKGQSAEFIALTRKLPVEKVRRMILAGDKPWWVVERKQRATKITAQQVTQLTAAGLNLREAARALGVSRQTVMTTLKRERLASVG